MASKPRPNKSEIEGRAPRRKKAKFVRLASVQTLTPRQSVEITGLGVSTTYKLLRAGKMPALAIGKRFYIPKGALLRWLESGVNPLAQAPDNNAPLNAA
jgi:excisionase family DNA binding protein